MITKTESTFWARIYMSGPIEIAKQVCRERCLARGLCVTIEPTYFIYTGGEEAGFVVGLINYPRFPAERDDIESRAEEVAIAMLERTCQHSTLIMTPTKTTWITKREEEKQKKECPHNRQVFPPCDTLETCTKCGETRHE